MKLRIALFLSATFLAAALALSVLPACSDEAGDIGDDSDVDMDCLAICGDHAFALALPSGFSVQTLFLSSSSRET